MSAPAAPALLSLDPVPALLGRARAELSADFAPGAPVRVARAPGRLDVMGGIAEHTGSLLCQATLDRAAAVVLQARDDRFVQAFSFDQFDGHRPFTLRIGLDNLAAVTADQLRAEFAADPNRRWAGYLVGCLFALHEQGYLDLRNPQLRGVNLAVHSAVPVDAGVGSTAAVTVAAMMNLAAHYAVPGLPGPRSLTVPNCKTLSPVAVAALCRDVAARVVGAPRGMKDFVTACYGRPGTLLPIIAQPHDVRPALRLPAGVRVVGINANVRRDPHGTRSAHARAAASIGHAVLLDQMRRAGLAHHQELAADPMNGYLANLDPDDYKRLFRRHVPELITGAEFVAKYPRATEVGAVVDPAVTYAVQHATDHHVLEARRVRNFVDFMEQASALPADDPARRALLDKAGHLMYASHLSYANDALLGADECDLLVKLVRDREPRGLYGARMTAGGSGGTVAVLCDDGPAADAAVAEVAAGYERQTGRRAETFLGSTPGAWHAGTAVATLDQLQAARGM